MPSCRQLHGLHGAALPRAVQYLQLRHDDLLDKRIRLGGEHVAMRILLKDLDAGPMHQESVVQDEKVIIENAECVTLFASGKRQCIITRYAKLSRVLSRSIYKAYLFYFVFFDYIAKSDITLT